MYFCPNSILSLNFQKTEQLPIFEEDKKAIFDILCESVMGERFIIEMQKFPISYFMERSAYYVTFPIQTQAVKGKWDFNFSRVYLIGILNYDYDQDISYWKKRQLVRSCSLRDDNGILMTDKLHFKFIQLSFFNKKPRQLRTHFDRWCYLLKNMETMKSLPTFLNEPVFQKALDVAKVSNLDANDYILYQISKSKKYDMELVEEHAVKRGEEIGKEIGIELGEEKKEESVVLTAYSKGLEPLQISDFTGISPERVKTIIENHVKKAV
jgi:predicted transposase/invertase (TIGR01784 family)